MDDIDASATYEVELKLRADHERVRERLGPLDAERIGTVEQVDTYYEAPHRSFADTDEALRIREERIDDDIHEERIDDDIHEERTADDATYRLTYKGPKVDAASKTREEHETDVVDPDAMDATLRALGFAPAATVRKTRERYHLDGYTITLDSVEGLGEFVEVEREAAGSDVESVRDGAHELLDRLGLDPDEQLRTSYLGLLLDDDE